MAANASKCLGSDLAIVYKVQNLNVTLCTSASVNCNERKYEEATEQLKDFQGSLHASPNLSIPFSSAIVVGVEVGVCIGLNGGGDWPSMSP